MKANGCWFVSNLRNLFDLIANIHLKEYPWAFWEWNWNSKILFAELSSARTFTTDNGCDRQKDGWTWVRHRRIEMVDKKFTRGFLNHRRLSAEDSSSKSRTESYPPSKNFHWTSSVTDGEVWRGLSDLMEDSSTPRCQWSLIVTPGKFLLKLEMVQPVLKKASLGIRDHHWSCRSLPCRRWVTSKNGRLLRMDVAGQRELAVSHKK